MASAETPAKNRFLPGLDVQGRASYQTKASLCSREFSGPGVPLALEQPQEWPGWRCTPPRVWSMCSMSVTPAAGDRTTTLPGSPSAGGRPRSTSITQSVDAWLVATVLGWVQARRGRLTLSSQRGVPAYHLGGNFAVRPQRTGWISRLRGRTGKGLDSRRGQLAEGWRDGISRVRTAGPSGQSPPGYWAPADGISGERKVHGCDGL